MTMDCNLENAESYYFGILRGPAESSLISPARQDLLIRANRVFPGRGELVIPGRIAHSEMRIRERYAARLLVDPQCRKQLV